VDTSEAACGYRSAFEKCLPKDLLSFHFLEKRIERSQTDGLDSFLEFLASPPAHGIKKQIGK
jgi:hypothetical protein